VSGRSYAAWQYFCWDRPGGLVAGWDDAIFGLATARAAEPTGTLTLACQGEKLSRGLSGDITGQDQASMGIIVNFKDRTVKIGSEWPDPISIRNLTETAITFADDQYAPRASVSGSIDRVTGDTDVTIDSTSLKFGKMRRIFAEM
jgi:hypothetical protein